MSETTNYLDAIADDIGVLLPDCPRELLRLYALLALVKGTGVTLENVHDAWSAWRAATKPDCKSLVPFGELSAEVQALDEAYAYAIRTVAADWRTGERAEAAVLPPGEWARVEILGRDEHTGWVTDSVRAGVPVLVIRDWDGQVVAEVPGTSLYRYVPLPVPLKRPERAGSGRVRAIAGPAAWDDDEDDECDGSPF